jgi:DNA-binding NtrC family response regulator
VSFFIKKHSNRHGKKVKDITDEAMGTLTGYEWLGNVRELENSIERAVILAESEIIEPQVLPPWVRGQKDEIEEPNQDGLFIPSDIRLSDVEKMVIVDTLRRVGGDKTRAAKILGISRRTIYRTLNEDIE